MDNKNTKIIRMCASCKKVIDQNGVWQVQDHPDKSYSRIQISHSICPDCVIELYPDIDLNEENETI